MEVPFKFQLVPIETIKNDPEFISRVTKEFLSAPFLFHQGAKADCLKDSADNIVKLEIEIFGISISDLESTYFLHNLISNRLQDLNLPFNVAQIIASSKQPNDTIFQHEKFRPIKSMNARALSKIKELDIPDEFYCPLSGDIMDEPVYDVRSPNYLYDQAFLQYWVNKADAKSMPATRLPYAECFIKVNYELKIKIIQFVQKTLADYNEKELKRALLNLKLEAANNLRNLNQGLRRAAAFKHPGYINIFLAAGANINAKDDNPKKAKTALHWAFEKKHMNIALDLIYAGAKIDIPNAQGEKVVDLIKKQKNSLDIQPIINACIKLELFQQAEMQAPANSDPNNALFGVGTPADNTAQETQNSPSASSLGHSAIN